MISRFMPASVRTNSRFVCLCIALGAGCVSATRASAQSAPPASAARTVSDVIARSLELEARGDVRGARQVVVDAFGAVPNIYEPCVRLAALSFQMGRSGEAVRLYRRAREMPENQPEATLGLGLALTLDGYLQVDRGALGLARAEFLEALIIDDGNLEAARGLRALGGTRGTGVDALASTISVSAYRQRLQFIAVHVPVRLDEKFALRFSAQQLNAPDFASGPTYLTATTQLFAGVVRDVGISTLEGMTFLSAASGFSSFGVASSVRVGGTFGGMATAAVMGVRGGTNAQVAPALFAQLHRSVIVSAGARIIHDGAGTLVSPMATLGLRHRDGSLDIAAHSGKERSALMLAQPTLQPYLGTSLRGVTGVLAVRVAKKVFVLAKAQFETSEVLGSFRDFGLGVRVAPR